MPKNDLSTTQVARILGLNYQTFNHWICAEIITCDVPAAGAGTHRRFTARDLTCALIARNLQRSIGFRLEPVHALLDLIREHWLDDDPNHAGAVLAWSFKPPASGQCFPSVEALETTLIAKRHAGDAPRIWCVIDVRHSAVLAARHIQALNHRPR